MPEIPEFVKDRWEKYADSSTKPNKIDTVANIEVLIKKGEKKGIAWIPCTFEALSYGIDINPALVKTKTVRAERKVPLNKPFSYHPGEEKLELESNEVIEWKEKEKCPHCGQPIIIAQVHATKYRSCPLVELELSEPAPEDVKVPVTFGFKQSAIKRMEMGYHAVLALCIGTPFFILSNFITAFFIYPPMWQTFLKLNNPYVFFGMMAVAFGVFLFWIAPSSLAKLIRLQLWVKNTKLNWEPYVDTSFAK